MSLALRVVLFFVSVFTCVYVARKLRKSQIAVMDTVYWICLSVIFVIMSLFPQIVSFLSVRLGFQSPVNLVFLEVIFLLLIKVFLLSIKVSQLEFMIINLTQEIAIRENNNEKNINS